MEEKKILLKNINVSKLINGYYLYTTIFKNQYLKFMSDTVLSKNQVRNYFLEQIKKFH